VIVTTFPGTVCVIERTLIPLKDGTTLVAAPATFPLWRRIGALDRRSTLAAYDDYSFGC
jgi:hypothetical protein